MEEQLDKLDLRLLEELQKDGRLTNNELGERIALSPSQCSRRRTDRHLNVLDQPSVVSCSEHAASKVSSPLPNSNGASDWGRSLARL